MVAYLHRHRLILPIAPTAGGALGLGFALAVAIAPAALLERLVAASGLPAILTVAAPPLGPTARMLLVLIGGGGLALIAGLALFLVLGRKTLAIGRAEVPGDAVPVLRRADAHPDAPARRPVFAHEDLGVPFLDVAVAPPPEEAPLPRDLDQPLAAFDPAAIPAVPRTPSVSLAPLARIERPQLIDPGDRFESFDPAPLAEPIEPGATIHALLDRLERGVTRHDRRPSLVTRDGAAPEDLHDALAALHRLSSDAA
jgi:hypothetical protein